MDITFNIVKYIIFPKLDFSSKIRFRQSCKKYYSIDITDLFNIPKEYLEKLTDEILCFYPNVEKLYASNNPKITNIKGGEIILKNLKLLNASGDCGISNEGLKNLPLIKLLASYNKKINELNSLNQLKVLDISYNWKITNKGLENLNLEFLCVNNCKNITNVNHLKDLKILRANWQCGINDEGIKNLFLEELSAVHNPRITLDCKKLNFVLKFNLSGSLKILVAERGCGIGNEGIKNLDLRVLKIYENKKITKISHLKKLKLLCYTKEYIDVEELKKLKLAKIGFNDLNN